jgi:hypothetical protein
MCSTKIPHTKYPRTVHTIVFWKFMHAQEIATKYRILTGIPMAAKYHNLSAVQAQTKPVCRPSHMVSGFK